MSQLPTLQRLFPANVISRAEETYLQRSTRQPRSWRRWVSRLITLFLAGYALLYMLLYLIGNLFPRSYNPFFLGLPGALNEIIMPLAIVWLVGMHFRLMFQTLSLSANSISRERGGGTWEVLVLTTVDSKQIVRGKWRAVIDQQWRRYALLGGLRGLVIVWVTTTSIYPGYYFFNSQATRELFLPQIAVTLLTITFVFLITLLNLGFTAACGLSASTDHRNGAIALARAFGTRLVVLLATVGIPLGVAFLFRISYLIGTLAGTLGTAAGLALVTMLDNGLTIGYQIMTTGLYIGGFYFTVLGNLYLISALLAMVAVPCLYVLLTWLMLRFAGWRAIRAGALPPYRLPTAESV